MMRIAGDHITSFSDKILFFWGFKMLAQIDILQKIILRHPQEILSSSVIVHEYITVQKKPHFWLKNKFHKQTKH